MGVELVWLLPWGMVVAIFIISWGITLWGYLRRGMASPRWFRPVVIVLRSASLLGLVLLLSAPVFSWLSTRGKKPVLAVLVDTSASMGLGKEESRLDEAGELARQLADEGELNDRFKLLFYGFNTSLSPLSPAQFEGDGELSAAGGTHLEACLWELSTIHPPDDIAGVVVFTDGRQSIDAPQPTADGLFLPVKYIILGEPPERDLAVTFFEVDSPLLAESRSLARVGLRALGMAGVAVTVTLLQGEDILASKTVTPQGDEDSFTVSLPFTPRMDRGIFRVELTSFPADELPDNDSAVAVSGIITDKIRVLLISSAPSLDYAFLKRAMEEDLALNLTTVCYSAGTILPEEGVALPPPATPLELAQYDAVFLLNPTEQTGPQLCPLLADYVSGGGGLLLLFTEYQPYPAELGELAPLLPQYGGVVEFRPRASAQSRTHTLGSSWIPVDGSSLPPLLGPRIMVVATRATPLAMRDSDGEVIMAESQRGFGRTLSMGMGEMWAWAMAGYEELYPALFGRVLRWLAIPHIGGPFVIEVEEGASPGQLVDLRVLPKSPGEIGERATVTISYIEEGREDIIVSEDFDTSEGVLALQFTPQREGIYDITAQGVGGAVSSRLFLVAPVNELDDPRPDEGFLAASAGQENHLSTENVVLELMHLGDNYQPRAELHSLMVISHPLPYLLVAFLLCGEWLVRRRWGAW